MSAKLGRQRQAECAAPDLEGSEADARFLHEVGDLFRDAANPMKRHLAARLRGGSVKLGYGPEGALVIEALAGAKPIRNSGKQEG